MKPLRLSGRARLDLSLIFAASEERFGGKVADRYERLVSAALQDVREDPGRRGVKTYQDLPKDVRIYHLKHSRRRLQAGDRAFRPRHMLVFKERDDGLVLIRVLHDAMDLASHVVDAGEG